jgi:hypothetical protein
MELDAGCRPAPEKRWALRWGEHERFVHARPLAPMRLFVDAQPALRREPHKGKGGDLVLMVRRERKNLNFQFLDDERLGVARTARPRRSFCDRFQPANQAHFQRLNACRLARSRSELP